MNESLPYNYSDHLQHAREEIENGLETSLPEDQVEDLLDDAAALTVRLDNLVLTQEIFELTLADRLRATYWYGFAVGVVSTAVLGSILYMVATPKSNDPTPLGVEIIYDGTNKPEDFDVEALPPVPETPSEATAVDLDPTPEFDGVIGDPTPTNEAK